MVKKKMQEKPMKANNAATFKALTALVDYLNKEVKKTSKCKRCQYRGKSFHGEPCYWHVDCGIEDYDKKASDNAMYLLKRFKLQKALSSQLRNCDCFATIDEARKAYKEFCTEHIIRASNKFDLPIAFEAWLFAPVPKKCTRT